MRCAVKRPLVALAEETLAELGWMSGYPGTPLLERARATGVTEVLRKPLQRQDIAESLGRIFGKAQQGLAAPVSS